MRIPMFPKFIEDEGTQPHRLRNTQLVVDGMNFFYHVYELSKLRYEFGCEANEYARYLMLEKLAQFKKANIKCYFIFKGGHDDCSTNVATFDIYSYDVVKNRKYVWPMFVMELTLQLLDKSGINYATSILYSKDDCVALAQVLRCPLLSNDIEYCFRKAPYINYQNLKYSSADQSILCTQYKIQDFLNKYSLTEKKAAMFAAMADNNIFPLFHFNDLFREWRVLIEDNIYLQNKYVLKWLSRHSETEALNDILNFLTDEGERDKYLKQMEKVLLKMNNQTGGFVTDYLYNDKRLSISRCDSLWFEKGVAMQHIPMVYVNLVKHKILRGTRAIETKSPSDSPSSDSIYLAIDIIKYAYNLLINYKPSYICFYPGRDFNLKVIIDSKSNISQPLYQCNESVFENGWKNIKRLKLFEHFLDENNISTVIVKKLPDEAQILFLTLVYFARKKVLQKINVTKEVHSVILCYVMLNIVNRKDFVKQKYGISREDAVEAKRVTAKYFKCAEHEIEEIFDGDSLNPLVQFQCCLSSMNALNTLCGTPFLSTDYSNTYNGTFVYKVLKAMTKSVNRQFLEILFDTSPSVLKLINKLIKNYNELLTNI